MKLPNTRKYPLAVQFLTSIILVLFVATFCFYTSQFFGYRVVALVLLMTVSMAAMLFEILPVLVAAVLSSIIWNFFFIPPLYTFHIDNAEDVLMFLLYFVIAMVNAVLTFKIREAENKARDKEEKENAIKLYNTLLSSLSHELRTPISTILGAVDSIKENKDRLTEVQKSILFSEIDTASIRLNRQVENLLNMSRLESGILKPKLDWCDVNELINSVVQKLLPGSNHMIRFYPDETLPFFKLDAGLLEQVLHNLIHNAIQYTPKNTAIDIEALQGSNAIVISVSDNGKGFKENEILRVFDKFYRIPNTKTGGSGLGLSIVKGFVEAMQGNVRLENNENGGALFTIEIPAEKSFVNKLKNE